MAAVGLFLDLTCDSEEEEVILAEVVMAKVFSPAKHISMDWICSCNYLNTLSCNSDVCEDCNQPRTKGKDRLTPFKNSGNQAIFQSNYDDNQSLENNEFSPMKSLPPYKSRPHQDESSPCKGSLSSSSLPSSILSSIPSSLPTTSTSLPWNGLPTLHTAEKTQITISKVTEKKKYVTVKRSRKSSSNKIGKEMIKGIGKGKDKKTENYVYKSSPIFSKSSKKDHLNSSIISTSSSHKMPGNNYSSSSSSSTTASSNSSYPTLSPALSPSFSPSPSSFTTSFPTFSPSISPMKDTRSAVTRRDTKKHNQLSATASVAVAVKNQPIINSNLPRPKFISELKKLSNCNKIIMIQSPKYGAIRINSKPVLIESMDVEMCDPYMNNNQVKPKAQNAIIAKTKAKKVTVKKVTAQKIIKIKKPRKMKEKLKTRAVRRSTVYGEDLDLVYTTLESHRIEAGKYLFLTETELKYLKECLSQAKPRCSADQSSMSPFQASQDSNFSTQSNGPVTAHWIAMKSCVNFLDKKRDKCFLEKKSLRLNSAVVKSINTLFPFAFENVPVIDEEYSGGSIAIDFNTGDDIFSFFHCENNDT